MKIACFYDNVLQGARAAGISPEQALRELTACGLELVYVGGWHLETNALHTLKERMSACNLGLEGMFAICDFTSDPANQTYRKLIEVTRELGGTNVLLIPGMIPVSQEHDRQRLLDNMVSSLKQAVAYGKEQGVAVSMEDFDGMDAPYCTITGLRYFMDAVPGLQCSFDTGNFVMYNEDELEAFEHFRDRLCTIHLKDRARTSQFADDAFKLCADGQKAYTPIVGSGYIRMTEILQKLKQQNYPGNVVVELFDHSPEHMLDSLKQSIQWVKTQIT